MDFVCVDLTGLFLHISFMRMELELLFSNCIQSAGVNSDGS
jgi:hypothetical protein